MEPNVREIVRDWRRDIVSEGMYMDPSIITEALETGEGVDEVAEIIALETKQEIADFSNYKTTGTLPVAEYLRTIMEQEFDIVEEGKASPLDLTREPKTKGKSKLEKSINRAIGLNKRMNKHYKNMLTDADYRKRFNGMVRLGVNNIQRNKGVDAFSTGNFDKLKDNMTKLVKDCRTAEECEYLKRELAQSKKELAKVRKCIVNNEPLPITYGANKKAKCTVEQLDNYIKWLNTEYVKLINERKKELKAKMESAEPVEELFGLHKKIDTQYGTLSDTDLEKSIKITKAALHNFSKNLEKATTFISPSFDKATGYTIATIDVRKGWDPNKIKNKTSFDDASAFYDAAYDDCIAAIDSLKYYTGKSFNEQNIPATLGTSKGNGRDMMFTLYLQPTSSSNAQSKMEAFGSMLNSMLNTVSECGFNPNQRNLNEITPMDGTSTFSVTPWSTAEKTVGTALCDICEAETDEELTEAMIHFARVVEAVNHEYSSITLESEDFEDEDVEESVGTAVRGAARNVRRTTRKVARKVDATVKSAKVTAKKTIDPVVALVDKNMEKFKKADAEERREIVLKGGLIPKIMRWLKRSIGLAVGVAVGAEVPIVALITTITFIGMICTDKYLDRKQRNIILRQLEDEIEIVNEKIDDSRGDVSKQKKYELMRIRNKLKRTSDKIRYNLRVADEGDVVQNLKTGKSNVK